MIRRAYGSLLPLIGFAGVMLVGLAVGTPVEAQENRALTAADYDRAVKLLGPDLAGDVIGGLIVRGDPAARQAGVKIYKSPRDTLDRLADGVRHQGVVARLRVAPARVSVKATTTEQLGFVGRGEGIAALAVALLEDV